MTAPTRQLGQRSWAPIALTLGVILVIITLATGGQGTHTLHIDFLDAGQLVTGDSVDIAGRPVGSVDAIDLAPDGTADVIVSIRDSAWPLHLGTETQIRLLSQSSVVSRYIALAPGPASAPALRDGGTIGLNDTQGVVDLDEVLDSFTPKVRHDLQGFLAEAAASERGVARAANHATLYGSPALSAANAFLGQLTVDPPALSALLRTGGAVMHTLALHSAAITEGIGSTATWFRAAAERRAELAGILRQAPAVLGQATATLKLTATSLRTRARPVLRALEPSAAPLASVIRQLPPVAATTIPALRTVRGLLPYLDEALAQLPRLAALSIPAFRASATSLRASLPFFNALRAYIPDIVAGLDGNGTASSSYDADGHFLRAPVQILLFGGPAIGTLAHGPIDLAKGAVTFDGGRFGLVAPCPGGAQNPADDKSNPLIVRSMCKPGDNIN